MFYLVIHAQTLPGTRRFAKWQGAYVCCWVNYRNRDGALVLARTAIRETGFRVRSVQEACWLRDERDVASDRRRYFREAQDCGMSLVYEMYPRVNRSKLAGAKREARRRAERRP